MLPLILCNQKQQVKEIKQEPKQQNLKTEIVITKTKLKAKLVNDTIMQIDSIPVKRFVIDSANVYISGIIINDSIKIDTVSMRDTFEIKETKSLMFKTYTIQPDTLRANPIVFKQKTKFNKIITAVGVIVITSGITYLLVK